MPGERYCGQFRSSLLCSLLLMWCLLKSTMNSVSAGSPSHGGDVTVYVWHKPTKLAHSFLFFSCVCFCLYGPFNCISFHIFSWQLCFLTLFFQSYLSALLVLSTVCLFMKVSFSPDIIPSSWLGSKHQLPTYLPMMSLCLFTVAQVLILQANLKCKKEILERKSIRLGSKTHKRLNRMLFN